MFRLRPHPDGWPWRGGGAVSGPLLGLPLVALVPGAPELFGLARAELAALFVGCALLAGAPLLAVSLGRDRAGRLAASLAPWGLLGLLGSAALGSAGPVPFVWALPYFAVVFFAVAYESVPLLFVSILVTCVPVAALRFAHVGAPLAPTLAHALLPAGLYLLFAAEAGRTRRLEREIAATAACAAADRERERRLGLARDAHDGLGPVLTAAVLQGELALRTGTPEGRERFEATLRVALDELRAFGDGAAPGDGTVSGVLEAAARAVLQPAGVRWALEAPDVPLAPALLRTLRLVAQEALANVIRHADARVVTLTCRRDDDGLRLVVEDDGRGLSGGGGGYGLESVRARATACGGRATWRARRPAGTIVEVALPAGEPA